MDFLSHIMMNSKRHWFKEMIALMTGRFSVTKGTHSYPTNDKSQLQADL